MIQISIDGTTYEVAPGDRLSRRDQSCRRPTIASLLPPDIRADPDLRHLHRGGGRQTGSRLRHGDMGRNERLHHGRACARRPDRGVRPHSPQSRALLYRLRQQQRQLHGPQHHQTARRLSTNITRSKASPTKSTTAIRSTVTIPISAFCAAAACRRARTCRSTRRYPSAGRIRIPACSGMAARPSANRAAFPAATASLFARATRSWRRPCSGTRAF